MRSGATDLQENGARLGGTGRPLVRSVWGKSGAVGEKGPFSERTLVLSASEATIAGREHSRVGSETTQTHYPEICHKALVAATDHRLARVIVCGIPLTRSGEGCASGSLVCVAASSCWRKRWRLRRSATRSAMAAVSAEIENDDAKTAVLMMRPAGLLLRAVRLPP